MELFEPRIKNMDDGRKRLEERKEELLLSLAECILKSTSLFSSDEEASSLRRRKKELEELKSTRRSASGSISDRDGLSREVAELEKKVSELEEQEGEELSILGAIIFEQKNLGLLSDEISFMDGDISYIKALSSREGKNLFRRLMDQKKEKRFERNGRKRYMEYGRSLLHNCQETLVQSPRAQELSHSIRKRHEELSLIRGELEEKKRCLAVLESELEFEASDLKGLKNEIRSFGISIYQEELEFSRRLYDSASSWLDGSTPEEVLGILESLMELDRRMEALAEEEKKLYSRAQCESLRLLIEDDFKMIYALEEERRRLDDRIDEIYREIRSLKGQVEEMEKEIGIKEKEEYDEI